MRTIVRTTLLGVLLVTGPALLPAQVKIGHFNSAAIIKLMPEAQDAQRQLDQLVDAWQKELGEMESDWKRRFEEYDKRKLIMSDQRKSDTEKELRDLDQKLMAFRNQKFGQNGELFQKQSELMKPVQDVIFTVVKEVAEEEEYDYIFDKSGEILLMYANEKHDVTGKILEKLKLSPRGPQGAVGAPDQKK